MCLWASTDEEGNHVTETRIPRDLRFTREHEWVRLSGETATVGITEYAQEALGELTYVELPETGTDVEAGGEFAVVESAKAASDVFAPVGGTVSEVNAELSENPGVVNQDPYGRGWLCRLTDVSAADLEDLLSPEEYEKLLAEEAEQS
jgi:glycine cleavage system H protein